MDKELAIFLVIALTAAMAGISTSFWIQAIINNDYLSIDHDKLSFIASAITSGLVIACIVLILIRVNQKIAFLLTIALSILWFICLIIYCVRKNSIDFK